MRFPVWSASLATAMATAIMLAPQAVSGRTVLPDDPLLAGQVVISGDWAFACSQRVCSAVGVPAADPAQRDEREVQPIVVRLLFVSGPKGERIARLHLKDENGSLAGTPFGAAARHGADGFAVPDDQFDSLLKQLSDPGSDRLVRRVADGTIVARLPRHGFAWGLAALQRVLALHADRPPVPLDPAIRIDNVVTIRQGRPVPVRSLPPVTRATCDAGMAELTAWTHQLGNGKSLLEYRCGEAGAFGPRSLWFTQDSAGAPLEPLILPDPAGRPIDAGQEWLYGTSLDSGILLGAVTYGSIATSTLSLDCGKRWLWVLTEDGFRLIAKQEMPICGSGLPKDNWLLTYDTSLSDSPNLDAGG